MDKLGITHEYTPPDTPQYNGVAGRALGLLLEKTIAMVEDLNKGATDRLWAEAISVACELGKVDYVERGRHHPNREMVWDCAFAGVIAAFGTVGYMRTPTREHKLAPRGEMCIMEGITRNYPSGTVQVRNVSNGQIVYRQNVSWYPERPEPGGGQALVWSRGG